jgi:hypothetical protein
MHMFLQKLQERGPCWKVPGCNFTANVVRQVISWFPVFAYHNVEKRAPHAEEAPKL